MGLDLSTKLCRKCDRILDLSNFAKNRAAADGLQAYWHDCRRVYYQANREHIKAQSSARQKANADAVRVYHRAYRERNRERDRAAVKERGAAWYEANKDRAIATSKALRAADPDRYRGHQRAYYNRHAVARRANTRRYFQEHPEKNRELASRRRAREREAFIDRVDYEAIRKRDNGICHICHNPVPSSRLHYDHVIPLAKGGAHSMENIKVSHARCNLRKGTKLV